MVSSSTIFSRTITAFSALSVLLLPTCIDADNGKPLDFVLERELIVGGDAVTNGDDYPYMTYVYNGEGSICGATLVAPNILLTAAHCKILGDLTLAQIGRLGSDVESVRITHKNVHPSYTTDNEQGYPDYDFMLLKIEKSFPNIPPVNLDSGDPNIVAVGREVITMGYGKKIDSEWAFPTKKLNKVTLDLVSCYGKGYNGGITERMICAARANKDSCRSDSGGPLIDKATKKQIGVTSFGIGCADSNYPGAYARVSKASSWIEDIISGRNNGGWVATVVPTSSSCMAGSTRVETTEGFVRVDELEIGMHVMGITAEGVQDPNCNVVAIGSNGLGPVYGNYTSRHFLLQDNGTVAEHGEIGEPHTDSLFDVLLDCPFGIDEVGTKFSAMANYYSSRDDSPPVSIGHHLIVYQTLLGLVRKTGTFWMYSKSYKNITDAQIKQSVIIDLMMECLNSVIDKRPCARLEEAAKIFVEEQFPTSDTRRRTLFGSNNITNKEETEHQDGVEGSYGDIISAVFPMLGSPSGEIGTVVFALREEVQRSRTPVITAVLGTLAAVAGSIAIIATVMIVRRNHRNGNRAKEFTAPSTS